MIRLRKRNEGAALIVVICTVSILSVLGSLLLVKTTNNRKMKEAERKAQSTFTVAGDSSKEMASALEIIAQEALKSAFSDLMLEYGSNATGDEGNTARIDRFNSIFVSYLKTRLEQPDAAKKILKDALGLGNSDNLDVTVQFLGDVTTNARTTGSTTSNKITIHQVKFVYNDGKGSQSSITTDISITAKIPDVSKAMAPEAEAAYEDFILITDKGVSSTASAARTLTGNVYVAKDFVQSTGTTTFKNAGKLLIKGTLDLSKSASVVVNNGDKTDSTNVLFNSGKGLWAGNIAIDRANIDVQANCYVKDDLTVAVTEATAGGGTAANVAFSGKEYVGFAGGSERSAGKNSAIMINTVKDKLVLDFSNTDALMLKGNSYIRDEKWNSGLNTNNDLVGVLQGESLAYKEMQALYLVPASCSPTGKNPMSDTEYNASSKNMTFNFTEAGLNLSDYVDSTTPFVTRFVRMDGGKTRYVYMYLNFASEDKANAYFKDYMNSSKGATMKTYLSRLGEHGSEIKLAKKNYTVSNLVSYNTAADVSYANMSPSEQYKLMITCLDATQWYGGLFYNLDTEITKSDEELKDHNMIRNMIVRTSALAGSSYKKVVDGKQFVFHNGNASTASNADWDDYPGILLVNGDLTIDSGFTYTGLILVTGDVTLAGTANLTADENVVRALLADADVAKFFRGKGSDGNSGGSGGYLSGDSIKIEFENWERN